MKKTDNNHSRPSNTPLPFPVTLDNISWVQVLWRGLAIAILLSSSACNGSTATTTVTVAATSHPHVRPADTSPVIPVATPSYTPTPTPCAYAVKFVEINSPSPWCVNLDYTIDLTLQNDGTCSWPEGTKLEIIDPTDRQGDWSVGKVGVGEQKQITLTLTAPSTLQTLLITWQLDGPGIQFVDSQITHTLTIVTCPTATPTSTPSPTATPIPPPAATPQPASTPRPNTPVPPTPEPPTATIPPLPSNTPDSPSPTEPPPP